MKNLKLLASIGMVVILAVTLLLGSRIESTAKEEPIELNYGMNFMPPHPHALADQLWIEKIGKETNGRVRIKPFWGGTLVSVRESYTELARGVADIAEIEVGYSPTGFDIRTGIYGFCYDAPDFETRMRVYKEICQKYPEILAEYKKVKPLAVGVPGVYQLFSTKPVRKMEDFKGKTIKATVAFMDPLKKMGAAAVNMPMGEVYISLQKGILDGALAPMETLKSLRFAEVTKYITNLNLSIMPFPARAMNWDKWNSLPPDIQKVFEKNNEWWEAELWKQASIVDQAGIDLAKNMGKEFIDLPPEELKKLYGVLETYYLGEAAKLDAKGFHGTEMFREIRRLVVKYTK